MKSFINLLVLLLFFCTNCRSSAKEPDLKVIATLLGVYSLPQNEDFTYIPGNDYFLIEVELINITNSPVQFITWSCGTGANVVFDKKILKKCRNSFLNNGTLFITLNPKEVFRVSIICNRSIDSSENIIRVGWIYLNKNNTKDIDDFFEVFGKSVSNLENVIWSNPINLSQPKCLHPD